LFIVYFLLLNNICLMRGLQEPREPQQELHSVSLHVYFVQVL
jgi:hypothetical protein